MHVFNFQDIDVMFEMFNRRYPSTKDLRDVLDEGCKDLSTAKESVDYYFAEKNKLDLSYTEEESGQILSSRTCLALMVAECQIKRAMSGLFGR
ncbi:hypothetical protein NPIL_35971 [Nephila pilipes]|uniref:Uncharacterized protein n=1 Tax=Nephila pilipes TaxID=299642 RepID=A0A8X6U932_NEPPI|nr:hypothetical protein NPIL_35971 [Nephila pilipes]